MNAPIIPIHPVLSSRQIAAIALGNGLEIYDFVVFSFFATTIAQQFFPAADPMSSLLMAFAVFGAGFIMRPLGALLLGRYADRYGRLAALSLSIWSMGLGTLLFVIVPTYQQVGVFASWLVLLARLLQGFSMGGEIGAATVYLLEAGSPAAACRRVSWQFASQGAGSAAGALVALALGKLLPAGMYDWGWRLAFALGLLIVPLGAMIRRQLPDTYDQVLHAGQGGYHQLWTAQRGQLLWGALMISASTASMYLMLNFLPSFLATRLQWPVAIGQLAALAGGLTIVVASPWLGRLADQRQWRQQLMWPALILSMLLLGPLFAWMLGGAMRWLLLPLVMLWMGLTSAISVVGLTMLLEAFPVHNRTRALAIIYSSGVTLFGGFSAFLVLKLIVLTDSNWMPALYLLAALALSSLGLWRFHAGQAHTATVSSRKT